MSKPQLVILYPQKMFKQFPLEVGTTVIGRGQDADIKLEDELVSRTHCSITFDGNQVMITDMGSTNGTYIDGNPITQALLTEENRLQVGSMVLKLEIKDSVDGTFDLKLYEATTLDETGAINYRTFMNRSLGEIILAKKNDFFLNIVMVETDHLDKLGDELGAQSAEVILKEIARILKDEKRDTDMLARYSEGKFITLMTGIGSEDAKRIAEKFRQTIEKNRFSWKDSIVPVSVSVGLLSRQGEDIGTIQEMVSECKKLLDKAKNGGGNMVVSE